MIKFRDKIRRDVRILKCSIPCRAWRYHCPCSRLCHSVTESQCHTWSHQQHAISWSLTNSQILPIYDGCRAQPTVGKYQFSISDKHTTNKPTVFSQCPIPVFVWSKITSCADLPGGLLVVGVGATETLATALVGYSVTVFTSSENCLANP